MVGPAGTILFYLALQAATTSEIGDVPDLVRHLFRRPAPPVQSEEPSQTILPTLSSSPAAGTAVGILLSRQKRSPSGALSVLTLGASYSTRHRTQIVSRFDQRIGPSDRWRLLGDWRFYQFTEETFGLGTGTSGDTSVDVPLDWVRVHATCYRVIGHHLAIGGGYRLDARRGRESAPEPELPGDGRTTMSSGASVDVLFDSRDNSINATRGAMLHGMVATFPRAMGSTRGWTNREIEVRLFQRVASSRRQVIGVWGLASFTTDDPPYFDLPGIGWDLYGRTGRGYAAGRYRGRDSTYAETEYRVDLLRSGLVGAVAFVNAFTFSDAGGHYGEWQTSGGFGFRLKLDKRYGSNLALDYGWGTGGSNGLLIALNETF